MSRVPLAMVLVVCCSRVAWCATVNVGQHALLPNRSGQQVAIQVAGGDAVAGVDLFVQIGDGGPELENIGLPAGNDGPAITSADLKTATIFGPTDAVQIDPARAGVWQVLSAGIALDAPPPATQTVPASGQLVTLSIDTTGIFSGTFDLLLTGVLPTAMGGPFGTTFVGGGGVTLPTTITNGTLKVSGTPFGDYNNNGSIDAADFTVWRDTLGQSVGNLAADGDGNGSVGPEDYTVWKSAFSGGGGGAMARAAGSSAVPEPSLVAIAIAAAGFFSGWRRWLPESGVRTSRYLILLAVTAAAFANAGHSQGIPQTWNQEIQQFKHLPVLTTSPDFFPTSIQRDNDVPIRKLRPKLSRKISSNFVGTTPPRLPRSEAFDLQPFRRIHLTDGDDQSMWMSRGQARPNVQSEWIRIELPFEQPLTKIVLRLHDTDRANWPSIVAEISRDGYQWTPLERGDQEDPREPSDRCEFDAAGRVVKQIRLTATELPLVNLAAASGSVGMGHGFCVRAVEILGPGYENLALISNGAGATVSSTKYGYGDKRSIHDMLWAIHYDLGVKHLKTAYWDDTLNWHYVETQRGQYQIDSRTDSVISECVENGCEVYLTLCYGNWLYSDAALGKERWRFWQFPFQKPPVPKTDDQIEAYCNFCRFMVRHFKGRIRYFEIWNEQNIECACPPGEGAAYAKLVNATSRVIKEENSDAKVMLGGVCFCDVPYFEEMFQQGVAECIDVLCWHPYQWEVAPAESYRLAVLADGEKNYASYRNRAKAIQDLADRYGFKGHEYHANETSWVSPYPEPDFPVPGGATSEIVKAKYVARAIALHSDLGIPVYYNETWNTGIVYWDVSLLRATYSADPQSPVWPQPAYYVLRTMATFTDDAKPVDVPLSVKGLDVPFESCQLRTEDGTTLIGMWLNERASDRCAAKSASVTVGIKNAKEVVGTDTLNGTEQTLRFHSEADNTAIDGLSIADYPLTPRIRE